MIPRTATCAHGTAQYRADTEKGPPLTSDGPFTLQPPSAYRANLWVTREPDASFILAQNENNDLIYNHKF